MSEYLSEQEQVDRIKTAAKKHGSNIITGVMLALTAYFGYQYWQNKNAASHIAASNTFQLISEQKQKLTPKSEQADKTKFYAAVKNLVDTSPESTYALQALFLQAQQQVADKKLADAETTYTQALALKIEDEGMRAITALRLAQVQIAQNKASDALVSAQKVSLAAFTPTRDEVIGDAHVLLKDTEKAKAAYQAAWDVLAKREESRPILQLKMEQLGMKPQQIKTPSLLKDVA